MGLVADVHRLALYAALATGCASWLPAPSPMRTIASRANPAQQARCLLVFMPGIGDSAEVFAEHGFIAAVRTRKLPIDIVSANATLGYYAKRTLHARIEADVLAPARTAGYQHIWFAGVSMGGLGSLLIARNHPAEIAGILLMAPYLGEDDVLEEISKAGGLARWKPPAKVNEDDYQRETWRWLKSATEQPAAFPSIYLASGDQDKLAQGHRLLGTVLPAGRRFRTRGAHDWGPWLTLWNDFLDHSDFASRCLADR